MAGKRYLSTTIADEVIEMLINSDMHVGKAGPPDVLSPLEREILQLIAEGNTNAIIAENLSLSVRTVESHRATSYQNYALTRRQTWCAFTYSKVWYRPKSAGFAVRL